jgi:hypothetical protein
MMRQATFVSSSARLLIADLMQSNLPMSSSARTTEVPQVMPMPRNADVIVNQANEFAARFEAHEPDVAEIKEAASLRAVREAFQSRAEAERRLADAVSVARAEGHSWAAIGAMVGTSGEAARQRYGNVAGPR